MLHLPDDDPLAVETVGAIRQGQVESLQKLLAAHPQLATARIGAPVCLPGRKEPGLARSLLHIATDWPGNFPRGAETVAALLAAGADPNARFGDDNTETPLHWAASCDDVAVLDALIDRGADVEAPGAVIAGGTPLADAVAFGQWKEARRLVERGAQANLWQAAALGLLERVEACFADTAPSRDDLTQAFWCACHGGQRGTAEYLLARGADINWVGYDGLTPLDAARRSGALPLLDWLTARGAISAA